MTSIPQHFLVLQLQSRRTKYVIRNFAHFGNRSFGFLGLGSFLQFADLISFLSLSALTVFFVLFGLQYIWGSATVKVATTGNYVMGFPVFKYFSFQSFDTAGNDTGDSGLDAVVKYTVHKVDVLYAAFLIGIRW